MININLNTANSTIPTRTPQPEMKLELPKLKVEKKKDPRFIDTPEEWKPYIESAHKRYPELPRGAIETAMMMESSMGKNKTNQALDYGQYGYLGGITKTGGYVDTLKQKKINPKLDYKILRKDKDGNYEIPGIENIDTPEAAINVIASELQKSIYKHKEGTPLDEIYMKSYVTATKSDSLERRKMFQDALKYYGNNLEEPIMFGIIK